MIFSPLNFDPIFMLLILLGSILVTFVLCRHFSISQTFGYLVTGMFLGPAVMGIFKKNPIIDAFSHVGLLLFLFALGLEIPIHRIRALRRMIFSFGTLQMGLTFAALWTLCSLFFPWDIALVLGFTLSLSSTAVVIPFLSERHELTTILGRASLSILLFQDVATILMLMIIGLVTSGNAQTSTSLLVFWAISGILLSLLGGFCIKKLTDSSFLRYGESDFITTFILFVVLSLSFFTEKTHVSYELGAFIAGVAMASTNWRHQISSEIQPLRSVLLAIFFISMGLEIAQWPSWYQLGWITSFLIFITLIKMMILWIISRKYNTFFRINLVLLMSGQSEFVFIMMSTLKEYLGPEIRNNFLMMAMISMTLTPLIIQWYRRRRTPCETCPTDQKLPDVLIAGFGHVGETIAGIFSKNLIPFVVVDSDAEALERARCLQYNVIEGDARDIDFLKRIKLYEAKIFLITFGHLMFTPELIRLLHRKFPELSICVQHKDYHEASRLAGLSVHVIVPEDISSGMTMASVALQYLGFSPDHARKMTYPSPAKSAP